MRAGRMYRPARRIFWTFTAAIALAVPSLSTHAQSGSSISTEIEERADGDFHAFYAARDYRPLWIHGSKIGPEADVLLHLLESADLDGLDPDDYRISALAEAIEQAQTGSPEALAAAEVLLSRRFAAYVRDTRRLKRTDMVFVDKQLAPSVPSPSDALTAAASARSLGDYLQSMGWMHPIYPRLRNGLAGYRYPKDARVRIAAGPTLALGAEGPRVQMLRTRLGLDHGNGFDGSVQQALREFQSARGIPADGRAGAKTIAALNMDSSEQDRILRININRARALPAGGERHVLVNAAAGQLTTYQDGHVADTMRVVVGRTTDPTPMMAALIRFAMVNPYWNVPTDLVTTRIAPNVLKDGQTYLATKKYEILSDWSPTATPLDPTKIDWKAVAAGKQVLRVRQLPGPENAMGRMKLMFPNKMGVYLHDTPDKKLLKETARLFSAGCVRLEDAPRLAKWLFGKPLVVRSGEPEHRVDLPQPVPVFITYLTAAPEGTKIVFHNDVYARDTGKWKQDKSLLASR